MRISRYASVLLLAAAACSVEAGDPTGAELDTFARSADEVATVPAPPPPADTDLCDDSTYAGVAWSSARSPHFVIEFFPGTAADSDQAAILDRLEAAYAAIRLQLGIAAEPRITLKLSPSRIAASAHGLGFGRAYPGEDRYEVIYTGAAGSYELERYGHELTHVLAYYLDPSHPDRDRLLDEGLAEYFDQSRRNRHDAYALQLLAGAETRVRVTGFDYRDQNGKNYGRAGSLVTFLVDRYGMAKFLEVFLATEPTWSPEDQTAMIDGALTSVVGEGWPRVAEAWHAEVEAALEGADVSLSGKDQAEIEALVATMDLAIETDDAPLYRSTMEGFYCEWGGEKMRAEIAARTVAAFTSSSTKVEQIIPTGIKNFRTATVMVRRTDARGLSSFSSLMFEHVPAGWRVAYGPDWY
jgi:hypothetical protein